MSIVFIKGQIMLKVTEDIQRKRYINIKLLILLTTAVAEDNVVTSHGAGPGSILGWNKFSS